jgi:L,D-transpeptidase catalytic domain
MKKISINSNIQFEKFKHNKRFKSSLLFLSLVLIILLHMPVAFANNKSRFHFTPEMAVTEKQMGNNLLLSEINIENKTIAAAYETMHLNEFGLSIQTFEYAIKGFNYLVLNGRLAKDNIISIVDFSLPSSKKRLFVIDLNNCQVLFNTYVAHGVNSGKEYANQFSNKPSSYKSSLGFYETQNTYIGGHGYSLRLEGLENGINDNASNREIVIHGAAYVNESLIKAQGYIGRSWGCPALPESLYKPIIDKIKNGSCLFIYSPANSYLQKSKIINA